MLCALAIYLGVFAISFSASILMDSLIVYYRYLGVAIGPLLFATVMLLSRIRSRVLVGAACAILLSVSALNMTLLVGDFYSSDNQEALDEVRQTVDRVTQENDGKAPLVVSSDIGYISLTTLAYPDVPQTYMDWQKGNWNLAYEAYPPTLTCKNSWEEIFDGYPWPDCRFGTDPKRHPCRVTLRTSRSAMGSSCGNRAPATALTNAPGLPLQPSIKSRQGAR